MPVYQDNRVKSILNFKFTYSEKAADFCEISSVDLSYLVTVKSEVESLQNLVAFSEYMIFTIPIFMQLRLHDSIEGMQEFKIKCIG